MSQPLPFVITLDTEADNEWGRPAVATTANARFIPRFHELCVRGGFRITYLMTLEMAEDPDDDGDIVRTLKRGFMRKGRVIRAEEVVMKKWKEGFLVALAPSSSQK